jgi:hypothetical protein
MDAANIVHKAVRFGQNQLIVCVDAAAESIVNRSGLVYYAEVLVPKAYRSGEFVRLVLLSGSEVPPRDESGLVIYDGWSVDIGEFLDGKLEWNVAGFDAFDNVSTSLFGIQAEAVMPYRVRTYIENNGVLVSGTDVTGPVEYVIKGRLNENQFPAWGDLFFTKYLDANMKFLTWQPDGGMVDVDMPVVLSFLTNFESKPTSLRLWCTVIRNDSSTETWKVEEYSAVELYSLLSVSVGYGALGLAGKEGVTGIFKYKIWLGNEADLRVSEERSFVVDRRYFEYVRYLVMVNSLGGIDVVRCTGVMDRSLKLMVKTAERALVAGYLPSSEEIFVTSISGSRELKIATGFGLNDKWIEYFEELAWSKLVYVVTQEGLVPVVSTGEVMELRKDGEYLGGRVFGFVESKEAIGYSDMPVGSFAAERLTAWVPEQAYCLVNENGVRIGKRGYAKLKLLYVDSGERVKGVAMKANVPGTVGYYAVESSGECFAATTPYLNSALTVTGSYKKNDCGVGFAGSLASIVIAAGVYGSSLSLADANAKASAAAAAIDTQAYANSVGTCLAMVAGVRGKYFNYGDDPARVPTLSTWMNTAIVGINRIDENINFENNWALGSLPEDFFCVRWTGYVVGPVSGLVRFRAISDDGVRLWVNDVLLIDGWYEHGSLALDGSMVMEAGRIYNFKMEYFEYAGGNSVQLRWLYGDTDVVVPAVAFFTEP